MKSPHSQQGATLIISMLILLVLTVLGISSMSNSSLETNMAHNFRLDNAAFHIAESSIDTIVTRADAGTPSAPNPAYVAANDVIKRILDNAGATQTETYNETVLDPNQYLGDVTPAATATVSEVRYRPENCAGLSGACMEYSITVRAGITGTSATATHVQIISLPVPKR